MPKETALIRVSKEMWIELNKRKEPGYTFEDVIWTMINALAYLTEK